MAIATISDSEVVAAGNSTVRDYVTLLKPGVMSLVVFTATVAMVAAPFHMPAIIMLVSIASIALGSGAAGAFNMWYDRDIDIHMTRTNLRPIPSGRVMPADALALSIFMGIFSVMMLGLATNWMAAGMLAFSIFFYGYIYTAVLKRSTPQNIVIGGAAGAFPPVIGWLAAGGDFFSAFPWMMFLMVFLWTPPHFWALAICRAGEYAKVNVPMLPTVSGADVTRRHMMFYLSILILSTYLPVMFGYSGYLFAIGATGLNGFFVMHMYRVMRSKANKESARMFLFSIAYLFMLFAFLMIDFLIYAK